MKRVNVLLWHIPDLVTACICLHNLCIIHLDGFDMEQAKAVEKYNKNEANLNLGNIKHTNIFMWQKKQSNKSEGYKILQCIMSRPSHNLSRNGRVASSQDTGVTNRTWARAAERREAKGQGSSAKPLESRCRDPPPSPSLISPFTCVYERLASLTGGVHDDG